MLLNMPALGGAKLAMEVLGLGVQEFQAAYPFGLSYASYTLIISLLFSSLQWFGVGMLFGLAQKRTGIVCPEDGG